MILLRQLEWGAVTDSGTTLWFADRRHSTEEAKKLIAVGESQADPKLEPSLLAARTMVVNQLMNLDEVLNK